MKKIISAENPVIKKIVSLKQKKYRDKENLFVIEGLKNAKDILKKDDVSESLVYLCLSEEQEQLSNEEPFYEYKDKTMILNAQLIKSMTDTSTSQGIFLVLKKPDIELKAQISSYSRLLVLDQISDPGNAGTIIRTALAANFDAIIALKGTVDLYNPKVVRSAMGAITKIPFFFADDMSVLNSLFKSNDYKILAADLLGDYTVYDVPFIPKVALLLGSEDYGIQTDSVYIDYKVSVPMNPDAESLNVAVAAGIIMYRLSREQFC